MVTLKNSVLFDAFGTYQAADMRSLMYTITHPPKYHAVYGLHDMEVVCDTENENNVLVCNGTFSIAETTVPYVGRSEDVISVSLPEPPTTGERYDYVIIEHIGQDVYVKYEAEPNESQLLLAIVKRYIGKVFVSIEDIYDRRQIVLSSLVLPEPEVLVPIIQECIREYTIRPDQLLSGELYNDVILRVNENKHQMFIDSIKGMRVGNVDVDIPKTKEDTNTSDVPLNYDILKYVIHKLLMVAKFPISNIVAGELLPDTVWVKQYGKRYVSIDSIRGVRTTYVNPYKSVSTPEPIKIPEPLLNNIQELKSIIDRVIDEQLIVAHRISSGLLDKEFSLIINEGKSRPKPEPEKPPEPPKKPPEKPPEKTPPAPKPTWKKIYHDLGHMKSSLKISNCNMWITCIDKGDAYKGLLGDMYYANIILNNEKVYRFEIEEIKINNMYVYLKDGSDYNAIHTLGCSIGATNYQIPLYESRTNFDFDFDNEIFEGEKNLSYYGRFSPKVNIRSNKKTHDDDITLNKYPCIFIGLDAIIITYMKFSYDIFGSYSYKNFEIYEQVNPTVFQVPKLNLK